MDDRIKFVLEELQGKETIVDLVKGLWKESSFPERVEILRFLSEQGVSITKERVTNAKEI